MNFSFSVVLVMLLGQATATPSAPRPNIVFLIGDDQHYGDYGFMGHPHIRTPNLDKLASESVVYRRGYVPSSLCRPSLATMITGLFPHQHKITCNDPPTSAGKPAVNRFREDMIKYIEKVPTLPRMLADEGYVSHQSGKWWEGNHCRCGFTAGMTHGDPSKGGRHGDDGLKIGRQGLEPVLEFVNEAVAKRKPFYLWYAPMMPHTPHNPPERLLKKYLSKTSSIHIARYWAMCEWFDETCGELLDHLDKKGVGDDTLIVYLADNGWIQDPDKPQYAPKSKRSQYDGGLRTPILFRWRGKAKPALRDDLAMSVDLVPTVLAALKKPATKEMPGINLLDEAAAQKRKIIFGEIFEHNAVDVHKPHTSLQYRWLVEGHLKLIVPAPRHLPAGMTELYDLSGDPKEENNLAATRPQETKRLLALLDAWWSGTGD
jgi:uncharacterized sulfatase